MQVVSFGNQFPAVQTPQSQVISGPPVQTQSVRFGLSPRQNDVIQSRLKGDIFSGKVQDNEISGGWFTNKHIPYKITGQELLDWVAMATEGNRGSAHLNKILVDPCLVKDEEASDKLLAGLYSLCDLGLLTHGFFFKKHFSLTQLGQYFATYPPYSPANDAFMSSTNVKETV